MLQGNIPFRTSQVKHILKQLARQTYVVTLLDVCVSSLRRGHANLLCIAPILTDDPRRESETNICCCWWRLTGRTHPQQGLWTQSASGKGYIYIYIYITYIHVYIYIYIHTVYTKSTIKKLYIYIYICTYIYIVVYRSGVLWVSLRSTQITPLLNSFFSIHL